MADKILVVVKDPGTRGRAQYIPNTLEAFQELVGGYIETVRLTEEHIGVVNEEGRLLGLKKNCLGMVGPIVVTGTSGEEFTGLSPEEADTWISILGGKA